MPHPIVAGRFWCPLCEEYVQLLKVQNAAKLIDVNRRTIYRYIEEGRIFAIKTVGRTYRVCSSCLLKSDSEEKL